MISVQHQSRPWPKWWMPSQARLERQKRRAQRGPEDESRVARAADGAHEDDVHGVEQAVDGHKPQQHDDPVAQRPNSAGSMPAACPMRNQSGTSR